jgi:hypothetical protein
MVQRHPIGESIFGEGCEQKPACSAHQCCEAGRSPYWRMHEHATTRMDIRPRRSKFSSLLTDAKARGCLSSSPPEPGRPRGEGRDPTSVAEHDQDGRGAPESRLPQARDRLPRSSTRPSGPRRTAWRPLRPSRPSPSLGRGRTLGARLGSPPMRTSSFRDAQSCHYEPVARRHARDA